MTSIPANDDDGFFNDLSRQPHSVPRNSGSPQEQNGQGSLEEEAGAPRPKRIACVICRKRKLKCDGNKPKCATCARLGHNCAYDEVRRKSGPKRGYVKELEARLAQVETQLSTKDPSKARKTAAKQSNDMSNPDSSAPPMFERDPIGTMDPGGLPQRVRIPTRDNLRSDTDGMEQNRSTSPAIQDPQMSTHTGTQHMVPDGSFHTLPPDDDPLMIPITNTMPDLGLGLDDGFSWEMIGLGLEEPMPMQEAIEELTHVYFEKIHPSLPMIHKSRYKISLNFAPERRPPICLRYAIWTLASAITDKYMHHQDILYRRARKYMELDEMKGQGEVFISIPHAQCWTLIAAYEFKMMYFPRAWMSVGRAARMVLMMGLNQVDGMGLDVKQCLPPPKDWTEREERRRLFWMVYCIDRYASIGTGWPMSIEEKDVKTVLPASEEAYESSTQQKAPTLDEAMKPQQVRSLSAFAGVIFVTHFFGLNLHHLHRPGPNDREHDLNGDFWKRHRNMDNVLSNTSLSLPSHLRLPAGVRNPNIVFLNFAIHTSTICLHQAAIFKAENNQLTSSVIEQSRARCLLAAGEIASVMRMTGHVDVAGMNPFMAFCLYVAARVFVQYLKKSPDDLEARASLEFLLTAMRALQRKNPLTESFLVQLNLDIEGSGLDPFLHDPDLASSYPALANPNLIEAKSDPHCAPKMHLSESNPEGLPGEDLRFPNWDAKESPTVRTEDPRQTKYAYQGIDLAAREPYQKTSWFPDQDGPVNMLKGIFPGGPYTGYPEPNGPNGLNPPNNNHSNNNSSGDTEMSDQANHSTGVTPQSSASYNHSSSNTSYSPPQVQDEDPSNGRAASMPPIAGVPNYYTTRSPPADMMFAAPLPNHAKSPGNTNPQDDRFKLPSGWDLGVGNTPGGSGLTGMTPEGGWDKMMEEMNWIPGPN